MKPTQYVVATALVLIVAAQAHAQANYITLTLAAGGAKKSISVQGKLTPPPGGYHPGKVTVKAWVVQKGGAQEEAPVQLTPKLSDDKTSWTYGPTDIPVGVGSANYNVQVEVTYFDAMNKAFGTGTPFANHGTQIASAP